MFGFNNKKTLFGNNTTNIFGTYTNNDSSPINEEKNKNKENTLFPEYNHVNKYVAYNTRGKAGPICYNRTHKKHLKMDNCIAFEETFDYYKNISKYYLNVFKEEINNLLKEFLVLL